MAGKIYLVFVGIVEANGRAGIARGLVILTGVQVSNQYAVKEDLLSYQID